MPIALMVVNTPTTDCIARDPEIAAAGAHIVFGLDGRQGRTCVTGLSQPILVQRIGRRIDGPDICRGTQGSHIGARAR